ncbi:hypothetical protein [Nonomuraea africana]|uniref:Secreted protein n=1 Tax=Nonomuraea africana TaxID=46171 RepID=A0ABR9KUW0_9ACTN|nr:hypothetical protein [Nonomuraea africana]MBE1565824.1 hypothetical protein [Nonomuraea africana]
MRRKLAVAALLAMASTGCGMLPSQLASGGEEKQPMQTEQSVTGQSTTEKSPPTSAPPASASVSAPPAEKLQAIASREVEHNENSLRVDITGLKRQGRLATLTWTVRNLGPSGEQYYVGPHLGTGTLDFTVAGVSLIDPVNGKRYRVARNGTGDDARCVCSRVNQYIKSGGALEMYAVYGAPPADVSTVTVEFPNLGVFPDVPVS